MFKVLVASQPPQWLEYDERWEWVLKPSGSLEVSRRSVDADAPLEKRYLYAVKAFFPPEAWLVVEEQGDDGQVKYTPASEPEE